MIRVVSMKWMSSSAIVVDITPDRVTFTDTDGAPVSLGPVVYVVPDGRRNPIVAVASPPPTGTAAIRVEVFSPESPPSGISKLECLAALFTQGLKTIVDRSLFRVRPEVLVRGSETVTRTFGGYERDLVAKALEQAGARRVRWPEEFVPE
jgi:hypothetical protein